MIHLLHRVVVRKKTSVMNADSEVLKNITLKKICIKFINVCMAAFDQAPPLISGF